MTSVQERGIGNERGDAHARTAAVSSGGGAVVVAVVVIVRVVAWWVSR